MSDILHIIYFGICRNTIDLLVEFPKCHKCLAWYNNIWKRIFLYHGLYILQKAYKKVTHLQRKGIHQSMCALLVTLAVSFSKLRAVEIKSFLATL